MAELRATAQRRQDVVATLEQNGHAWLATAAGSTPHVIVTQAVWNGRAIIVATRHASRTARNLDASRIARLAFGNSDDAIVVDVEVASSLNASEAGPTGATFERAAGWDPAEQGADWRLFVLRPTRIQAYRGYREIEGREVMRDGRWLA